MHPVPCALSISGLDPGGGAGILADLRAFAAAGAWGCATVAVETVQSTAGLKKSLPRPPHEIVAQIRELFLHQNVRAIKIGALGTTANVRAVTAVVRKYGRAIPVIVDPVMGATLARKGAPLLEADALGALRTLLSLATLVTPNALEAEALLGMRVRTLTQARDAAQALVAAGARAALVKGGHLGGRQATDILVLGDRRLELSAHRVRGVRLHGTGCTLASLIAGKLAMHRSSVDDDVLISAVRWAKKRLGKAIDRALSVGDGCLVLRP
jgi:hydroxymethylpyrimidine/phosphomethylpyrimidine kinase